MSMEATGEVLAGIAKGCFVLVLVGMAAGLALGYYIGPGVH